MFARFESMIVPHPNPVRYFWILEDMPWYASLPFFLNICNVRIYTTKQWHSDVVAVIFVGVYPVGLSLLCVTPLCEISSDGIVVQMWWYNDCWLANSGRVWRFTNLQHLHINFDTLTSFGLAHLSILSRLCQFVWPFFLPPLPSLRVTLACVCVRGGAKRVIKGGAAESWFVGTCRNSMRVRCISEMVTIAALLPFAASHVQLQACDQSIRCNSLCAPQKLGLLTCPFRSLRIDWLESLHASAEVPKARSGSFGRSVDACRYRSWIGVFFSAATT